MNNIVKQPPLPDTIHFHHTVANEKTEVLRITRNGLWINPDIQTDEVAKAVLNALDAQIKLLIRGAVESERESCAKIVDAEMEENAWESNASVVLNNVAAEIRARGE